MRSICLYFQVHQPFRLRTYRFFNIGDDHHYYDDYQNRHIIRRVSEKSYLPANNLMLDLIKEFGSAFKVSYSISGTALEQFAEHVPEVIDSFRKLADTGQVEFLAETYAHSLSSLGHRDEFERQVEMHASRIEELFGKKPVTFRNTELIYSDRIGEIVSDMGFHTMLTEGAKHILGWKSPNYMYCSAANPRLKLLLRNFRLSDDLTFRFSNQDWSEWPLTTDKFVKWLNQIDKKEEVVNLFLDYETIGEHQWKETGIFDFFRHLPEAVLTKSNFTFSTPENLYNQLQPVAPISVLHPISWADEERDLTAWLGNELQDEAFGKLYSYKQKMQQVTDDGLLRDWLFLQTSNHFYYMCTKWFSAGEVHRYFNPYNSPYEAFINYMNVLSDFMIRVDDHLTAVPPAETKKAAAKKAAVKKPAATKKKVAASPAKPKTKAKAVTKPPKPVKEKAKAVATKKPAAKTPKPTKEEKKIVVKKAAAKPKKAVKTATRSPKSNH